MIQQRKFLREKLEKLEAYKVDQTEFEQKWKDLEKRVKDTQYNVEDIGNALKKTDAYVDRYLPFNMCCTYFEVLRIALEPSQLSKIKDYEEYRLKDLYQRLLEDHERGFDKTQIKRPTGYELSLLSKSQVRLNSRNRRIVQASDSEYKYKFLGLDPTASKREGTCPSQIGLKQASYLENASYVDRSYQKS